MMDILVVGCGSIARRHIHNFVERREVRRILVLTRSQECFDALDKRSGKIVRAAGLERAAVDGALICNETYRHMSAAVALAKKGIPLFIEKPVSHGLASVVELRKITARKKVCVFVGYNMRFLGAIRFIKNLIEKKRLGDLYFARIEAGQYLPDWRKGTDYRKSYSASRRKGGGVALDLSHEIDYMRFLFGEPKASRVVKRKVSRLQIDSEDLFEGLFVYEGLVCSVHMDYLRRNRERFIRVEGSRGTVLCDLAAKRIVLETNRHRKVLTDEKLFDMDATYRDEIGSFIKNIEQGSAPLISLHDGIRALELIEG